MRFIIDRFEGAFAICEGENQNIIKMERIMLPLEVKEGDVIEVEGGVVRINRDETLERKRRIERLSEDLWS